MSATRITGGCLCGRVAFELALPVLAFVHCHCSRCRKSSGAAHATNVAVHRQQVIWTTGAADVAHYALGTAARFGKSFCRTCGCPVPRSLPGTELVIVPAGSLDGPLPHGPTDHLHWGSRAAWGCAAGDLPTHAGAAPA